MLLQLIQIGANTVVILYAFNQLIPHPHIEGGGFIITVYQKMLKNYADGRIIVS